MSIVQPVPAIRRGVITSFGLGWRKSEVKWIGQPRLFGHRASRVADFGAQEGIYVLYNSAGYHYVGISRAGLGGRLKQHLSKRKWDRFSWFGFRQVDSEPDASRLCGLGTNVWKAEARPMLLKDVIRDFEAVLTRLPVNGDNRLRSTFKYAEEWKQLRSGKAKQWQ